MAIAELLVIHFFLTTLLTNSSRQNKLLVRHFIQEEAHDSKNSETQQKAVKMIIKLQKKCRLGTDPKLHTFKCILVRLDTSDFPTQMTTLSLIIQENPKDITPR